MAKQSDNKTLLHVITDDENKIMLLQGMINKVDSIEGAFSLLVQDEVGFWIFKIYLPGAALNSDDPEANIEMNLMRSAITVNECSIRTNILDEAMNFYRTWNGITELKDKLW